MIIPRIHICASFCLSKPKRQQLSSSQNQHRGKFGLLCRPGKGYALLRHASPAVASAHFALVIVEGEWRNPL